MIDYFNKKDISQRAEDELLYEYVMEEMEQEANYIKGLWAKSIAYSEGDNEKAKSLYMQYRVQSIKDTFKLLEISYRELSKEKLWDTIKNSFGSYEEKQKMEQEQKVKQEKEKYGKIKGWLVFFAILIVLNNISMLGMFEYFKDEYYSSLEIMSLNGQVNMISNFNKIFYLDLTGIFMIILLTIAFFTKSNIAKLVAIGFFSTAMVMVPLKIYFLYKISPEIGMTPDIIRMIGSLFWAIIFLFYFIFSKRVKKTFVRQKDATTMIILSLVIPVLFLVAYTSKINNIYDSDKLISRAFTLGDESLLNDDENQAKVYYEKAVKLVSDSSHDTIEVATKVADKYFDNKDYNNAIHFYKIAVPENDNASSFRLAYSYFEIKDYNNTITVYEAYLRENQYEGAMYNLGIAYEKVSKYRKAQEWFKKAFDIYTKKAIDGDKEAMDTIAAMYLQGWGVNIDSAKAEYWKGQVK